MNCVEFSFCGQQDLVLDSNPELFSEWWCYPLHPNNVSLEIADGGVIRTQNVQEIRIGGAQCSWWVVELE